MLCRDFITVLLLWVYFVTVCCKLIHIKKSCCFCTGRRLLQTLMRNFVRVWNSRNVCEKWSRNVRRRPAAARQMPAGRNWKRDCGKKVCDDHFISSLYCWQGLCVWTCQTVELRVYFTAGLHGKLYHEFSLLFGDRIVSKYLNILISNATSTINLYEQLLLITI